MRQVQEKREKISQIENNQLENNRLENREAEKQIVTI